jgi:hypothetical protein
MMTVGQPSDRRRRLLAFNINALLVALLLLIHRPVVAFGTVGKITPLSSRGGSRSSLPPTQQQRMVSASASVTRLEASLTIYGHPGSRSPLVNWACLELAVPFEMGDLDENPHPFGQMPCLTDGEAVIFESGAILQYFVDRLGQCLVRSHLFPQHAHRQGLRHGLAATQQEGEAVERPAGDNRLDRGQW